MELYPIHLQRWHMIATAEKKARIYSMCHTRSMWIILLENHVLLFKLYCYSATKAEFLQSDVACHFWSMAVDLCLLILPRVGWSLLKTMGKKEVAIYLFIYPLQEWFANPNKGFAKDFTGSSKVLGVNCLSQYLPLVFSPKESHKDELQRGGLYKDEYKMKHGIRVQD